MPPNLDEVKPQKGLLRYLRWRDLIVVVIGVTIGLSINNYYSRHRFTPPSSLTDYQKWQARPRLSPHTVPSQQPKQVQSGHAPCFFIIPSSEINQPVVSGSVGECLLLVPDGTELDLIEVDLGGAVFPVKTDLFVGDSFPLAFTRTYFPKDDWSTRNRIFLPHVYDPYLTGNRYPYTYLDWMLPDRQFIHYQRISPGTSFADAVYENPSTGPVFGGSRVAWNGWGWDLAVEDGMTYLSPEAYNATRPQQGSLVGIFDKQGNEVRLSRNSNGDLTEVKSPSGRWIRFQYDQGHLIQAADNSGKKVEYEYDSNDRLRKVKYPSGQSTTYSYDTSDRLVRAEDSVVGTILAVEYVAHYWSVARVTAGDRTYDFQYVRDELPNLGHVDITDPQGEVTRVKGQRSEKGFSYTVEKVGPVSSRRQGVADRKTRN
jgi:YD repeat-containing protein